MVTRVYELMIIVDQDVDDATNKATIAKVVELIEADGGSVLLTARSANALLDTVVNNSGTIRANSLIERNGDALTITLNQPARRNAFSAAMRDALERSNISTQVMSAIPMSGVVDHYDRRKAIRALSNGDVVIFAAGTGNPFFTTDSSACLRGIEVDAELVAAIDEAAAEVDF